MSVKGNKLLVKLDADRVLHTDYEGQQFGNADMRIQIAQPAGQGNVSGLNFWSADKDNWYSALIGTDGKLYVVRKMRGKILIPVAPKAWEGIRTGAGQVNALRVVTSGTAATIFVNDKQLFTMHGSPPKGGGKIGVHCEAGSAATNTFTFSELRVSRGPPAPAIPPSEDKALLLADDFETFDLAWGHANEEKSVQNGQFLVTLEPFRRQRFLNQSTLFDDVDLSVKFTATKGWTNQLVGLAFWGASRSDYHEFHVISKGMVYAGRYVDGKWSGKIVDPRARAKVFTEPGQVNELRVVAEGKTARLFVNGEEIAKYEGTPPEGGHHVGLYVQTSDDPSNLAFSEFRVRTPPE